MRASPFQFLTTAADWSVFATLTFRGDEPSILRCRFHLHRWTDLCAHKMRTPSDKLLCLGRMERGEVGGRLHLHVLLVVPVSYLGFFLLPVNSWAHCAWGCGGTRFRRVVRGQDGALEYAVKDTDGGNEYELAKTSGAADVVPSVGLLKRAKRAVERRRRGMTLSEPCTMKSESISPTEGAGHSMGLLSV